MQSGAEVSSVFLSSKFLIRNSQFGIPNSKFLILNSCLADALKPLLKHLPHHWRWLLLATQCAEKTDHPKHQDSYTHDRADQAEGQHTDDRSCDSHDKEAEILTEIERGVRSFVRGIHHEGNDPADERDVCYN